MTYDKETATEIFRNAILEALDDAAERVFGFSIPKDNNGVGATDADLPELFRAIDGQLAKLSQRYEHPLYTDWVGSPRYVQERDFLRGLGVATVEDEAIR